MKTSGGTVFAKAEMQYTTSVLDYEMFLALPNAYFCPFIMAQKVTNVSRKKRKYLLILIIHFIHTFADEG